MTEALAGLTMFPVSVARHTGHFAVADCISVILVFILSMRIMLKSVIASDWLMMLCAIVGDSGRQCPTSLSQLPR